MRGISFFIIFLSIVLLIYIEVYFAVGKLKVYGIHPPSKLNLLESFFFTHAEQRDAAEKMNFL
jgi:hypothetical protein